MENNSTEFWNTKSVQPNLLLMRAIKPFDHHRCHVKQQAPCIYLFNRAFWSYLLMTNPIQRNHYGLSALIWAAPCLKLLVFIRYGPVQSDISSAHQRNVPLLSTLYVIHRNPMLSNQVLMYGWLNQLLLDKALLQGWVHGHMEETLWLGFCPNLFTEYGPISRFCPNIPYSIHQVSQCSQLDARTSADSNEIIYWIPAYTRTTLVVTNHIWWPKHVIFYKWLDQVERNVWFVFVGLI